ncbi:CotH kinase family protein [Paracrocinitomix mangrovi]|uniref:CotH kinase family protein n=1 Tax=Paracrocinitomix mangrovi TaxID=2862509 RepID=UPI001C8D5FC5|nr:CotH kinase family protein [Paracrocinitomix mangrovi]UKN03574.1 CotH kinase family protein [Paracrocinitomix mangrovi]
MKQLLSILLLSISFVGFNQQLSDPIVSYESGYYSSDITVNISHPDPDATIFYTLNGSEPNPQSPIYSGPITMGSKAGVPDNFALIPTNPSLTYPIGDYTESRANNRGWLPPYSSEIYKFNILRVKVYKAGFVPSNVVTKTFIIDPAGASLYSFPVVSFVMDSIDLFSNSTGIYHYGFNANYTQKGPLWEREAHIDYFDTQGNLEFSRNVRTRIHGGGSRHSTKKTFRIYAEHDGYSNFDYEFFQDTEQKKFKRMLIRTGGHRPDCFPRDNLTNSITKGLDVEQQHFRHVIVFINGEYWGIHSMKERVDKYFIQNIYGIDDDDLTILDQEFDVQDGSAADSLEMSGIEAFVDNGDMSDPTNYEWVTDRIDIDNYIDYMAAEIFLSNEDWVYSNIMLWRKSGSYSPGAGAGYDGKFRWIFYDFDGAYGGSCDNAYYTANTLESATVETGIYSTYTRLFRGLLENEEFKTSWINRVSDLMNSHFRENVMVEKINAFYDELTPEMPQEIDKWRYPSLATTLADRSNEVPNMTQWDTTFYYLNRFGTRRQRKIREHIMDKWGYPDTSKVTIDVSNVAHGSVKINTIQINSLLPGVDANVYPWTGMYIDSVTCTLIAIPQPGYEFVEWQETGETNDTINWVPNGDVSYTAIFQAVADYQPVVINEVMPSNSNNIADNFGEHDDWLELYNPNSYAVDLSGCRLKKDTSNWIIPNGTVIAADGYLLFWHDNEEYQGADHTSFKLNNTTKTVYLYDQQDNIMDLVIYPETTTDYSYGRYPNGSSTFETFTYPTPRENNNISTVESPEEISSLQAFPNPSNGIFHLNKAVNYSTYSLDGKLIQSKENSNQINLIGETKGVYILRTDKGETIKIVLQP